MIFLVFFSTFKTTVANLTKQFSNKYLWSLEFFYATKIQNKKKISEHSCIFSIPGQTFEPNGYSLQSNRKLRG